MKTLFVFFAICWVSLSPLAWGQSAKINKVKFFADDTLLTATLVTNMSKLMKEKMKGNKQAATFRCQLPDGTLIDEQIRVEARGNFRRNYCYFPPLKLNFRTALSPRLSPLNSLKLVCACRTSDQFDQYVLKEYLIYKIYNLLTKKSFKVRLIQVNFEDSLGKKKPFVQHAFLVENEKELAKRNKGRVRSKGKIHTEATNRKQMTLVALFEYMIGNTDWSVAVSHNIKLIQPKKDSTARPFAVPYDFDYSGLVNTIYAIPDKNLRIESVRERVYRGFPRTIGELTEALDVFKKQKESIYALINQFELLSPKNRKEMITYLDEFYKQINNPLELKAIFIQNARTL
jgi:hypothetical protein